MSNYEVVVNHAWTAIFEADSEDAAKEQALAVDEEISCNDMGIDVEVEEFPND